MKPAPRVRTRWNLHPRDWARRNPLIVWARDLVLNYMDELTLTAVKFSYRGTLILVPDKGDRGMTVGVVLVLLLGSQDRAVRALAFRTDVFKYYINKSEHNTQLRC